MSTAANTFGPLPALSFALNSSPPRSPEYFSRLGRLSLTRPAHGTLHETNIELLTPGLMCSTSRGIIQHLSRDNVRRTPCIKWVHVPFESFLQVDPPVPTQQEGSYPLHNFLGFPPAQHVISLSLRDPSDGREMPPNGKMYVAAQSLRGTRKVASPVYRSYVIALWPDIVFSLSDVPFTPLPHSQKRISKSIERSLEWLSAILAPLNLVSTVGDEEPTQIVISKKSVLAPKPRFNVFLHLIGGTKPAARAAFAAALLEPLEIKERQLVQLETLDEGVSGYVFDLVPMRAALLAERQFAALASHSQPISRSLEQASVINSITPLLRTSLEKLPETKPRLVNTVISPHEILTLIRDVGIDLFDTFWAQQAATWGVALDFRFPVPLEQSQAKPLRTEKRDIGHNLYNTRFADDMNKLADSFVDGLQFSRRKHNSTVASDIISPPTDLAVCTCAACSPMWSNDHLKHDSVDDVGTTRLTKELAPPYTRAYLHHLLHTHEMSAHALLVMHNLTVLEAFMHGIRTVLKQERGLNAHWRSHADEMSETSCQGLSSDLFATEVALFEETYDGSLKVLDEAKACWAEVDHSRGKGRLARERERAKILDEEKSPTFTADIE